VFDPQKPTALFTGRYPPFHVFYGRNVGYAVEPIDLDLSIETLQQPILRKKLSAVG
jgi:hypothetical protein